MWRGGSSQAHRSSPSKWHRPIPLTVAPFPHPAHRTRRADLRHKCRRTKYLLPPSVDEWLPQDHLARFVVEVIDQLDLSELVRQYAGRGSAAYHPAVLLGLLVYGYATGVHSSRKIERACHDSVAFRFIAANTQPDRDSIATFRRRFLAQIEALLLRFTVSGSGTKLGERSGG
jgi:transposase